TGDWLHPQIFNPSHSINISPDTITGLAVKNRVAYITGDHSDATKNDFFSIDVSDPTFPFILKGINTGPGLAAVAAYDKYAYVANMSTTAQLQVIDISDPSDVNLVPAASRKVAGTSLSVGNSIFYYKNMVYLGLTARGTEPQLAIFDVSTPTNPVPKGTYTFGHDVNAIMVKDNYAYIARPA